MFIWLKLFRMRGHRILRMVILATTDVKIAIQDVSMTLSGLKMNIALGGGHHGGRNNRGHW